MESSTLNEKTTTSAFFTAESRPGPSLPRLERTLCQCVFSDPLLLTDGMLATRVVSLARIPDRLLIVND